MKHFVLKFSEDASRHRSPMVQHFDGKADRRESKCWSLLNVNVVKQMIKIVLVVVSGAWLHLRAHGVCVGHRARLKANMLLIGVGDPGFSQTW